MDDKRIATMMKKDFFTSKMWKGFLAPDLKLPYKKSNQIYPQLYFVNTAPTYSGGEHWCLLIIHAKYCEFFDSFGQSPDKYDILKSFVSHCKKIVFNGDRYQSYLAKTCGHHCIFFAILRARGISTKKIKSLYKKGNFQYNDSMVFDFVLKRFGKYMAHIMEV
jgi:hypothetical protein